MIGQHKSSSSQISSIYPPDDDCYQPSQPWNVFQSSEFEFNRGFPIETFGSFHSFTVRDLDLKLFDSGRLPEDSSMKECFNLNLEEQPFMVMPYLRGTSVDHNLLAIPQTQKMDYSESNSMWDIEREENEGEEDMKIAVSTTTTLLPLGQDLQSPQNNHQSGKTQISSKRVQQKNRGFLAKNVTKNIGKLLMKYIWKNRISLRQKLNVDQQTWQHFLCLVISWKKQNNITRQFLLSRWSGASEEARLFRTAAHHFFRKECLGAIYQSNIHEKSIHVERIYRFDQALSDPKALDFLS